MHSYSHRPPPEPIQNTDVSIVALNVSIGRKKKGVIHQADEDECLWIQDVHRLELYLTV